MNKLLAALLFCCAPVYAQDPKVEFFTPDATGCMILKECKEDVVQITDAKQLFDIIDGSEAEKIADEFSLLINIMVDLGVEIFIAPARYFVPNVQGMYHSKFNSIYLNLQYMRDSRFLISTLRHEGWHLAQDCMAGTIDNSIIAVIMDEEKIPGIHKYLAKMVYAEIPFSIPWEQEAKWAEATEYMTADALKACKTGAMWEIYEPTPLTRQYLIDEGFIEE